MSTILEKYDRCTRSLKCPVCGKPDWCLVAHDRSSAICGRVPDGGHYAGEAGWLHRLEGFIPPVRGNRWRAPDRPADPEPTIDAEALCSQYRSNIDSERVRLLALSLGRSQWSLELLRIGWSDEHQAYTFPMVDHAGRTIGIRLRGLDGRKWAVRGSKSGIFRLNDHRTKEPWVICEGPTDLAAAYDIGLTAIGRPSCNGGTDIIHRLCMVPKPRVVIVADGDKPKPNGIVPGRDGAHRLADVLWGVTKWVRVVFPLAGKDMREWVNDGLTGEVFENVVENTPNWARRANV